VLNSLTSNDSIRPNTVGVVDLHATNMAATVICESCLAFLLFNSFGVYRYRHYGQEIGNLYGPGEGAIFMDDVSCNGWESSLANCSHLRWGMHSCKHAEDVSIACSVPTTTVPAGKHTCRAVVFKLFRATTPKSCPN